MAQAPLEKLARTQTPIVQIVTTPMTTTVTVHMQPMSVCVCSFRITNTETYQKYSQNLIVRSQVEREGSEKLRSDIDCFLRTSAKEMWNRFNQVNTAILARIQEITNARNRLQIQLEKVGPQQGRSQDFCSGGVLPSLPSLSLLPSPPFFPSTSHF